MVTYANALAGTVKAPVWILEFPDHSSERYISSPQFTNVSSAATPGLVVLDALTSQLDLRTGALAFGEVECILVDTGNIAGSFFSTNDSTLRAANATLKYGFSDVNEVDFQSIKLLVSGYKRTRRGLVVTLSSALHFLDAPLFEGFTDEGFTLKFALNSSSLQITVNANLEEAGWTTSGHILLTGQTTGEVELVEYESFVVLSDNESRITLVTRRKFSVGAVGKSWSSSDTGVSRVWAYEEDPVDLFLRLATTTNWPTRPFRSKINFTILAESDMPPDWHDHDLTVYSAGVGHGWDSAQDMGIRNRDNPASADDIDDTFAFISANDAGRTWLFDCPDGRYEVTVRCGDADFPQEQRVLVQGQVLMNNIITAAAEWVEETIEVEVTGGQMTIKIGDAVGAATTINSIFINQMNGPFDVGDGDGLGESVPVGMIDTAAFEALRDGFLSDAGTPRIGIYHDKEEISSVIEYFTAEFLALGMRFAIKGDGTLTVNAYPDLKESATATAGKIVAGRIVPVDREWDARENNVEWRYGYNPGRNSFHSIVAAVHARSQTQFGKSKLRKVEARGLYGSAARAFGYPDLGWDIWMRTRAGSYLVDFADPSPDLEVVGFLELQDTEVGSLVTVTHGGIWDMDSGSMGVTDALFYVTSLERDPENGRVLLGLRQRRTIGRVAVISPDGFPVYGSASTIQKQWAFVSADSDANFADGGAPYEVAT